MAKGISLHVGLNTVDTGKYTGSYQPLRNAENDTSFYYELAVKNKYEATKLAGKDATANKLLGQLNDISTRLMTGDSFFLSYSGHGTRVKDQNGDEDDGFDEVLVLYDRLFIDDEFRLCWSKFKEGVKIFFINDSCYNGTVSRFFDSTENASGNLWPGHVLRGIDSSMVEKDFEKNIAFYRSIKTQASGETAACSIIHIGACQDDQLADDGSTTDSNGKFTGTVRQAVVNNSFAGSYKEFFDTVKLKMPPWQTPNWDTEAGKVNNNFEKAQFLLI
ncbi:MAG: caspase family protein [Ferruginibacter sp.]